MVRRAIATIFVIETFHLARFDRKRNSCFLNQLRRLFVHAYHGICCTVWSLGNVQDIFHVCEKICVLLGWNHPVFSQMRLKPVFLSVLRTVSSEM